MPRGGRRPGAGRPKGSPNKITSEARSVVKIVVEENLPELRKWFAKAWKDDGHQAARMLERLMDFGAPRLARAEAAQGVRKDITEFTDDELAVLMGGEVGDAAAPVPAEPARQATGADLGVAPKPPEPAALPAPAPDTIPLAALSAPARREEPAKAAPIEGELMPRYRTEAEREALEEDRRERARADIRRRRADAARAAVAEWDQKAAEYVAEIRQKRRDPSLTLAYSAIALAIGPRPPGPGL